MIIKLIIALSAKHRLPLHLSCPLGAGSANEDHFHCRKSVTSISAIGYRTSLNATDLRSCCGENLDFFCFSEQRENKGEDGSENDGQPNPQ